MVLFFNDAQPTHSIIVPFCMLKLKSLTCILAQSKKGYEIIF